MVAKSNRVYGLDILKAICAFMVIVIHANFPGTFGYYAIAISRISVPVFFMITGYFYVNTEANKRQLVSIKRICIITLTATLIYFIYSCLKNLLLGKSFDTILAAFGPDKILNWVFFNDVPLGGHLWYLYALLYTLLVVYCLNRFMPDYAYRILVVITPVLLLADLIFGKYSVVLLHREFPHIYVRNFICVGIPYFTIGYFLRKNEVVVDKIRNNKRLVIALIMMFSITTCLEKFLLDYFGVSSLREHYISTTLLSVIVLIFFTGNIWDGKLKSLKYIGERLSLYIYIIHPIVLFFLGVCIGRMPQVVKDIYTAVMPIMIFLASVIASDLFYRIKKQVRT